MRALILAAIGVATLAVPTMASADVIENADLTFASGATFDGTITFSNDFSVVDAVNGTLTGYQAGIAGYVGSGSDAISTVFDLGFNSSPGPYLYYLLDNADPSSSTHLIQFVYASDGTGVTLLPGSAGFYSGNNVDLQDAMVSGTVTSSVPEPGTVGLLALGLLALGAARRRAA